MRRLGVLRRVRLNALTVAIGAGLLCGIGSFGAAAAGAAPPVNPLPPQQCAIGMGWPVSERAPQEASPYSGYSMLKFDGTGKTPLAGVAITIEEQFPAVGYGGWFVYPNLYALPTDGLTFPNTVPAHGSVNPFTRGTPIFAPNRHFTILMTADGVQVGGLPKDLRAFAANRITWPEPSTSFNLLQRAYGAKAGYDVGGTHGPLNIPWATIRTWNLKTGQPIDCGAVEPFRDQFQQLTPWNTIGWTGFDRLPRAFGAALPGLRAGQDTHTPKPNHRLVEFFRVPSFGTGLPGGVVPPPLPDKCANYIAANLNQRDIALIRVPKVPSFQSETPSLDATYSPTETGYYVWQILGRLRQEFRPNSPFNFTLAGSQIHQDKTGGATFVVWPRSLGAVRRRALFALARAHGWNLLEGNAQSPQYANSLWIRANGPASTYTGAFYPTDSRSGVPCPYGPQSVLDSWPATASLTAEAPDTPWNRLGEQWADVPAMTGSATPQGVECDFNEFAGGRCLSRLRQHMTDTGGSYTAA
jgi:hypothetical protein